MPLRIQDSQYAMTKRLQSAIKRRACGLFSRLDIEEVDRRLVLRARCATYHGVQMAIAAIEGIAADFPEMAPASAEFMVGNRRMLFRELFTTFETLEKHAALNNSGIHTLPKRKQREVQTNSRRRKPYEPAESLAAVGV